ncbi:histidine kinase [Arenibacter sp. BSSL-BM3]|uniref:Histidine kinase n=1 Tax=Arenibacter arenosicollis TaxID=2762274 RepID=A0ABR7QL08_9FLAO|nr:histidine kinase [Arenibacter arenosicollis]MBC8767734.1 histidine kinase [Arenibacter arenosicollis]
MKIHLPQYNGLDNQVMILISPVYAFLLNCINFGSQYFSSPGYFLFATIVSFVWFCLDFVTCGAIAVFFRKRYPSEEDVPIRLTLMVITFLITTGLFLVALFNLFESIPYFNYRFNESAFAWSYLALGIISIFLTFLMEGISRFKEWQINQNETEKLNQAYRLSQLQGLKSQVNPHFLFNSLNCLSCLIQEDEQRAENFLDEMSRVYRYMLRNDDEPLVTLQTELNFVDSYKHLLKARFGDGLQLKIAVDEGDKVKFIAPLTLQVIIENAFAKNKLCKSDPLLISISSNGKDMLEIVNNIEPKVITDTMDFEANLDNLINKYELLDQPIIIDEASGQHRVIKLPLIHKIKELTP